MPEKRFKIFIVEDDIIFAKILSHYLSLNPDNDVEVYNDAAGLFNNIHKSPLLISLDYNLPGATCIELLGKIMKCNSDINVVIVSDHQNVPTAIELLKKGAYDYILKDQDTKERLWSIVRNIKENNRLKQKIADLESKIQQENTAHNIIKGDSNVIKQLFSLISKAVSTDITVSIYGETGTGKELVAKSIHYSSARKSQPFVAVNVSAIPTELIESEMFGYEKGAFTGAINRRIGRFEEAHNGTLFLDEIGDMDLNMQAKLLRVLQEEEVVRLGGNIPIKLKLRVIVATHKNLLEMVKNGTFREDLYYRLLGLPIYVPPLRERGNDITILSKHFVDEFCNKNSIKTKLFSRQAIEKLQKYSFPGNVRELKAIIELATVMSNTDIINEIDIVFSNTNENFDFFEEETSLEEYNKRIIKFFLNKYNNKVRLVAEKLKIGKSKIYKMIQNNEL